MKIIINFFIGCLIQLLAISVVAGQISAEFSDASTRLQSVEANKRPLLKRKFNYKNKPTPENFVSIQYHDNESPDQRAWWLRAELNPYLTKVQDIYVNKIDSTWCYANEFTKDLFPLELKDDISDENFSFSEYFYLYPNKITKILALTGVYERCNGQKGLFVLILDLTANKRIIQLLQFDSIKLDDDGVILLYKNAANRGFTVYFCYSCDVSMSFQWNKNTSKFIYANSSYDLDNSVWKDLISNEELDFEGLQFYIKNFPAGYHSKIVKLYLDNIKYAMRQKSIQSTSKKKITSLDQIIAEKNLNLRKFKLLRVMRNFPKSEIFKESLFNLGMTEYSNSECEAAYFSLNTFAISYPEDARTPKALLYSGQSLIRAGFDTYKNLSKLSENYPLSSESVAAKKIFADRPESMESFENQKCW